MNTAKPQEKPALTPAKHFSLVGLSLHIGIFIAVCVLFFILAGIYLDSKFGTMPLFLILGVILSMIVNAFEIYRIIKSLK